MSKISKQVDQQQSDSDLSLQLSDASSLTSDSDLSDTHQQQQQQRQQKQVKKKAPAKKQKKTVKKPAKKAAKNKKKVKDDSQYCTCRRGYDGKEFMIECDGCQGKVLYQNIKLMELFILFVIKRVVPRSLCRT